MFLKAFACPVLAGEGALRKSLSPDAALEALRGSPRLCSLWQSSPVTKPLCCCFCFCLLFAQHLNVSCAELQSLALSQVLRDAA